VRAHHGSSRASPPAAAHEHSPQRLWDAAQQACARSQALIAESRATLSRHRAAVAALRSALPPRGREVAPRLASNGRAGSLGLDEEVVVGSLTLLPLRRAIARGDGQIRLTPAEWSLLVALVTHRSRILSRSELATAAWGPAFAERHGEVEVYVSRLRRKLAPAGAAEVIRTVRGQGYRLCLGDEQQTVTPSG
jgi:DNA-binding response OmpR family regulator